MDLIAGISNWAIGTMFTVLIIGFFFDTLVVFPGYLIYSFFAENAQGPEFRADNDSRGNLIALFIGLALWFSIFGVLYGIHHLAT